MNSFFNSNLEMRKIWSLSFMYEISEDGRILRNTKSKKQVKIFFDINYSKYGCYAAFVYYKKKLIYVKIQDLVAECWLGDKPDNLELDHKDGDVRNNHYTNLCYVTHNERIKNLPPKSCVVNKIDRKIINKPVKVSVDDLSFPSIMQAAFYIAKLHGKEVENIRVKLKKRRSNIFGHNISYCRD